MDASPFHNALQQIFTIHQELNDLHRRSEQLAHAAGQALEDFIKLMHPASVPPNPATEHSL